MAADFSDVRTVEQARALAASGVLVAVRFFPAEFGGPDDPANIGYVTPRAAADRERAIAELRPLVANGTYDAMDVVPDYTGDSFVPTRIRMEARNSATGARRQWVIEIWPGG